MSAAMGQTVVIRDKVTMGNLLLIDTDRSFTGQDGQSITPDDPGRSVPGLLAEKLFALDLGIDHLHVLQNTVSIRRGAEWDDDSVNRVASATEEFLRFYSD